MGNFIPEGKIQPDIKAMLDSWGIARNRYEYNPDLVPQRMQCTYTNNFSCFGYVDRNSNLVILPVWISDFTGCEIGLLEAHIFIMIGQLHISQEVKSL